MAEVIKDLELGENEVYLGELKAKDRYQVLVRHLNVIESYLDMLTKNISINSICLIEQCKKQGIDIDRIINSKE